MRTNSHTRKTMPQSWIDFFEKARTKKWGKYFPDGIECAVARPEIFNEKGYVQVAERRAKMKTREYLEDHNELSKNELTFMDRIFNKTNYCPGIFTVCCTNTDSGVYIYDHLFMRQNHLFLWPDAQKRKDLHGHNMGKNDYLRVPIEHSKKIINLWDVPRLCSCRRVYQIARWQYEFMLADTNEIDYDKISTWEDLPDWVLWKYLEADGSVIEGREEAFEAYKRKTQRDKRYVPCVDWR